MTENTSLGRFSASPDRQNRPGTVCGIPDSGRLAAIFAGLEPARLCYLAHLQAKVLAKPNANLDALCQSIATK